MRKNLFLASAALAALLVAPSAPAATIGGVVVAKNPLRKAVVVTAANGTARTVTTPRWRALRVGQRLVVSGRAGANGTFTARSVRTTGRASTARLRAVVVAYNRTKRVYAVSAGGSTFALKAGAGRTLAGASQAPATTQPGTAIVATVDTTAATAQTAQVTTTGQVGRLKLEGIVTELSASSLKVVVPEVGFVTVAVPAGLDLSRLRVFDKVDLTVGVSSSGTFTLISASGRFGRADGSDDDEDDDDDSDDSEDSEDSEDTEDSEDSEDDEDE